MPDLVPIALFAFRRPEHTRRTLEALASNPEFAQSPLHIFCDGSRGAADEAAVLATRAVVRSWTHRNKTIIEASANRGLAASIIDGVTRLCASHGNVIVVEDDLVVAPVFLDFVNRALEVYADEPRVMQVSGHMFAVDLPPGGPDAVFMPFTTSWGWATWQRAWAQFDPQMRAFERLQADRVLRRRFDLDHAYPYFEMLKKQKVGKIDSWAIRWYLSVFNADGLVLYPRRSLVNNEGFDGSGTNCDGLTGGGDRDLCIAVDLLERLPDVVLDARAFQLVSAILRSQNTLVERTTRYLKRRLG